MADQYEDTDILKCGICRKLLDIPKTLPCIHMFCETCLCEFISSEAKQSIALGTRNIPCPICATTFSFPENVDVTTYVRQFPTHSNIEAIVKWENLTLHGAVCGPCQRRKNIKKTNIWCAECEEGLCDECCGVHETIKTTLSHKVVDITDTKAERFPVNVDTFCMNHEEEKLDHFCREHGEPCCHLCVTTQHSECNIVTTLQDTASISKNRNEAGVLIHKLEEALDAFRNEVENREIFLQHIEVERDEVKSKIATFRTEINTRLNYLEGQLDKDFQTIHGEKCKEIKTETKELKNTSKIISSSIRLLQILRQRSSDISIFLEKEKIKRKLKEQEDIMANLSSEPTFKVQYQINFSPELVYLKTSLQSLGTVKCVKVNPVQTTAGDFVDMPIDFPKAQKKDDQLRELMTFTANICDTRNDQGVELLADGRILVTHYKNKSLYILDNKGELQKELQLPGKPCDVTVIQDNEAAVTYHSGWLSGDGVCIVNMDTFTIKEQNIFHDHDYGVGGITSHGDKLIIADYDKIIILDIKGSLLQKIRTPSPNSFSRFITSVSEKVFCYTNDIHQSVVCIDVNGAIIFKYKHTDLKAPQGIASDRDGVIYITGHNSNNVHQLSSDGKLIRILLCKHDGVAKPRAIHFDRRNNKLVLTHSKSKISIFKVNQSL